MKINTIIIDDEERGIIALKQLIATYCSDLQVVGEATNIIDAEELIRLHEPDVIFLDIEMPDGNGFQLLDKFNTPDFDIIFVTAYEEYALKAIKFAALDYLLKPVNIEELQAACERIKNHKVSKSVEQYELLKNTLVRGKPLSRIILSTLDGYYPVRLEDIVYCKADDSYTHFYLSGHKHHVVSKNLKEIESLLLPHSFFRVHKSYLINLNQIEKINKTDGISVTMSNSDELPVSTRKKDEFLSAIKTI